MAVAAGSPPATAHRLAKMAVRMAIDEIRIVDGLPR